MFILKPTPDTLTAVRFRLLIGPLGLVFAGYVIWVYISGLLHGFARAPFPEVAAYVAIGIAFAIFGMHTTRVTFDTHLKQITVARGYPFLRPKIATYPLRTRPHFQIQQNRSGGIGGPKVNIFILTLHIDGNPPLNFGMPAAFRVTIGPSVKRINAWLITNA